MKNNWNHFENYRGDELFEDDGSLAASYRPLVRRLNQISPEDLSTRQHRLEQASGEISVHYALPESSSVSIPDYPPDVIPRVLSPKEWAHIEKGVLQRTRAFEAFVADVYGPQEILKQRIIPYAEVLSDPAFLREVKQFGIEQRSHILVGAVDLIRQKEGHWSVVENHYAVPLGISYAIFNRRLLRQTVPELFDIQPIEPVSSFTTRFLEALRGFSPEKDPRIVLLEGSGPEHNHFAASFLARRMGLLSVQQNDLLVRNNYLYVKTIGGLEKVDVVYRRVRSTDIDPVAFGSTRIAGIPGLMSCLRKGNVSIVNSLGTGVADNKAILRYSDTIIRFYLRENPILPTLNTWHCCDPDQYDYIRRNRAHLNLLPTQSMEAIQNYCRNMRMAQIPSHVDDLFENHPRFVVAQPADCLGTAPRYTKQGVLALPVKLRVYLLFGAAPYVLPGGLTLQAPDPTSKELTASKDTWIPLPPRKAQTTPPARQEREHKIKATHLRSRAAESFYWMARYAERAENTARMVKVLDNDFFESANSPHSDALWPLWQAVALSTGQESRLPIQSQSKDTFPVAQSLLFDTNDPASVASCLRAVRGNAQSITDFIVPEVWQLIHEFSVRIDGWVQNPQPSREDLGLLARTAVEEVARLNGTFLRTMPHDDGYRFYQIGTYLERANCTLNVLDHVLDECLSKAYEPGEENPDLTALLRLLGSLDAYRREYRSRVYIDHVASLLWQNETTPSSAAYCISRLGETLRHLSHSPEPVREQVASLLKLLKGIRCGQLFPNILKDIDHPNARQNIEIDTLRKKLDRTHHKMIHGLNTIHEMLDARYFSHQFNADAEAKTDTP